MKDDPESFERGDLDEDENTSLPVTRRSIRTYVVEHATRTRIDVAVVSTSDWGNGQPELYVDPSRRGISRELWAEVHKRIDAVWAEFDRRWPS